MKERPILFNGPMVRALLDGSKTQTRRVVKMPDSLTSNDLTLTRMQDGYSDGYRPVFGLDDEPNAFSCKNPYGQPGDRLWVRETFDFLPAGGPDEPQACVIVYWATGSTEPRSAPESYNPMIYGREKVRPSIHMPRWASRITLEVTGVRVERLHGITRGDAMAEGCPFPNMAQGPDPRDWYAELWGAINGPGNWDANPWVWVVEFRRLA